MTLKVEPQKGKAKKPALFDAVLSHLERDLYGNKSKIHSQQDNMVHYMDSRTGRKAFTSASRWYAIASLVPGLRKRFIGATDAPGSIGCEERTFNTIKKFLDRNEWCRLFNSTWSVSGLPCFSRGVFHDVCGIVYSVSHESVANLETNRLASSSRVGPGSSAGLASSLYLGGYDKLCDAPVSYTNRYAYALYKLMSACSPTSWFAERKRQINHGQQDVKLYANFQEVPKTNAVGRSICTHGSVNMQIQLAIHSVLADCLKHIFHLDLADQQDHNKQLAKWGSKGTYHGVLRTWNFATEDLSMASDYPYRVMHSFLSNWPRLRELVFCTRSSHLVFSDDRTASIAKSLGVKDNKVRKHIMSTMGNGYTFALMTFFFTTVVHSLYERANLPLYDTDPLTGIKFKTWAVFGDDIIVDASVRTALHSCLRDFGFVINKSKSYGTGFFRESCGGDYYDGTDVRPVFCESLDTTQDIYSLLNRLTDWGVFHSVDLPLTLRFLKKELIKRERGDILLIPGSEDVCHGIHVPIVIASPCKPSQKDYHGGFAYVAYAPRPKKILVVKERSVAIKWTGINFKPTSFKLLFDPCSLQAILPPEPLSWGVSKEGDFVYKSTWYADIVPRARSYKIAGKVYKMPEVTNRAGVLLSIMGGYVREGTVGVRRRVALYEKVLKYVPGWNASTKTGSSYTRKTGTTCYVNRLWEEYVIKNGGWERPTGT